MVPDARPPTSRSHLRQRGYTGLVDRGGGGGHLAVSTGAGGVESVVTAGQRAAGPPPATTGDWARHRRWPANRAGDDMGRTARAHGRPLLAGPPRSRHRLAYGELLRRVALPWVGERPSIPGVSLPISHQAADQARPGQSDPDEARSRRARAPSGQRIVPTKRRLKVGDLWRDIPVIRVLAARDFKVKYKQSLLGPLWLVFQPLALLARSSSPSGTWRTCRPRACPTRSSRSSGSASGRSSRPR